jgi:hypothetical protein
MPSQSTFTRREVLVSMLGLILSGCSGTHEFKEMLTDERGLKQFAELYRNYSTKHKRGPKSLKELDVKGQGHPIAVEMLKSGELIVQWGAPLVPENETADAVLAYVKTVPEQGGNVLMQDGWTIKNMTADEFKAAPRAGSR